jgi:hypothetical protein
MDKLHKSSTSKNNHNLYYTPNIISIIKIKGEEVGHKAEGEQRNEYNILPENLNWRDQLVAPGADGCYGKGISCIHYTGFKVFMAVTMKNAVF